MNEQARWRAVYDWLVSLGLQLAHNRDGTLLLLVRPDADAPIAMTRKTGDVLRDVEDLRQQAEALYQLAAGGWKVERLVNAEGMPGELILWRHDEPVYQNEGLPDWTTALRDACRWVWLARVPGLQVATPGES